MPADQPISFARGAPSLDIIAVDELRAAADRAFQNDPGGTFSYGTAGGYPPLRDWVAEQHQTDRPRGPDARSVHAAMAAPDAALQWAAASVSLKPNAKDHYHDPRTIHRR